jgi:hypothetical protein
VPKICLQAKLKCFADHEVAKLLALWLYASELFLNNSCSGEHGYSQYYSMEYLGINGNNCFDKNQSSITHPSTMSVALKLTLLII